MKDLPRFRKRSREKTLALISEVLTNRQVDATVSQLERLEEFESGYFRAIFRRSYFVLPEGQTEPSKSQWSGLKKKLKRHEPTVFVFKEHGEVAPGGSFYLDFGFLPPLDR